MQLNDTHLVLLSAAAQRDDRLLVRPDKLRGRAAELVATKLEAAGLIETIPVGAQDPHWRTAEDGAPTGLRLLKAGLIAIGVEVELTEPSGPTTEVTSEREGDRGRPAAEPRGTKRTAVLVLLRREEGASIADIMAATGWPAHSTRAALTGLRKAGYALTRTKDAGGRTFYRVTEVSEAASSPQDAGDVPAGLGE